MADRFITSAAISGTTLTVQTGSKLVENYYSYYESDEYFTGSYTYDRYVYEDEFGLTVGDKISDDYEGKAKSNTAARPVLLFHNNGYGHGERTFGKPAALAGQLGVGRPL